MSKMTEELSGKSDELMQYQEEISSLLSQIIDLQHKLKEVSSFIHSSNSCLLCTDLEPCTLLSARYIKQNKHSLCPFKVLESGCCLVFSLSWSMMNNYFHVTVSLHINRVRSSWEGCDGNYRLVLIVLWTPWWILYSAHFIAHIWLLKV